MSKFVQNKRYELILPTSYVDIESEEMEYIDGGWSMAVAARNAWGYAQQKGMSRAMTYAGLSLGTMLSWSGYGFAYAVTKVGYKVAKIGSIVGGAIGAALALGGTGYLIKWLGDARRFY